ncbi:hypothetical protein [Bradyrhizobium jicamae]|uniref:hypothetical protein n=1 Tax=Bradyrhizobium jicamae TaxID=280332 RepID=UPI000AFB50C8|nr:hypothetical protein [Bradyrhizobium jicamae]
MNAMLSKARAKVRHRLAMHLRVDLFRMRNSTPMVGSDRAFDETQSNNGWLIFHGHDVTERPSSYGCSPALPAHALDAASRRNIPALPPGGGDAMRPRLNPLFALSVDSPLVSMVNFPCCVCSALFSSAPGVARRVTPQPMRAAVRMKAGVDVYL